MERQEGLTRRDLILSAGKVVAGAAIITAGGLTLVSDAEAYKYNTQYKYKKLNVNEVGQITYDNYFKRWCCSSVLAGLVEPLKKTVGGTWKNFPIDAYKWAHGGFAGWGTLCGALTGAGIFIGLVVKDTDIAEAMTNDLAFYYAYTELPSFTPKKILKSEIKHKTIAGTPICHISVGRWMRAEGVGFLTNARAERCARLSANIAMEAARMLNEWIENGKYRAKHTPLFNVVSNGITSQHNCMDCHGNFVPSARETYNTLKK